MLYRKIDYKVSEPAKAIVLLQSLFRTKRLTQTETHDATIIMSI